MRLRTRDALLLLSWFFLITLPFRSFILNVKVKVLLGLNFTDWLRTSFNFPSRSCLRFCSYVHVILHVRDTFLAARRDRLSSMPTIILEISIGSSLTMSNLSSSMKLLKNATILLNASIARDPCDWNQKVTISTFSKRIYIYRGILLSTSQRIFVWLVALCREWGKRDKPMNGPWGVGVPMLHTGRGECFLSKHWVNFGAVWTVALSCWNQNSLNSSS